VAAWNGRQALLFDLASRKFYIFGMVLWPQDIIYLTAILIIAALRSFSSPRLAGASGAAILLRRPSTPKSSWIERQIEGDRRNA
jgi:hypothetical protein